MDKEIDYREILSEFSNKIKAKKETFYSLPYLTLEEEKYNEGIVTDRDLAIELGYTQGFEDALQILGDLLCEKHAVTGMAAACESCPDRSFCPRTNKNA